MADNAQGQKKWYVVHTYSGYENKVKANLDKTVENNGLQDLIGEVNIPTEEVLEIKNGKSHIIQRKHMPGYVLVHMVMTNESWYIVRNTRGVTGFVGMGNKPESISDEDYAKMMAPSQQTRFDVSVGDDVRILNGIFENFTGKVKSIDPETKHIVVVVEMLARATEVELELDDVVRVEY